VSGTCGHINGLRREWLDKLKQKNVKDLRFLVRCLHVVKSDLKSRDRNVMFMTSLKVLKKTSLFIFSFRPLFHVSVSRWRIRVWKILMRTPYSEFQYRSNMYPYVNFTFNCVNIILIFNYLQENATFSPKMW